MQAHTGGAHRGCTQEVHAGSADGASLIRQVHATPIPCCGMAGDRGMRYPELTGASLQHLELPSTCSDGYSTSRTCEISLSNHSGMNFRSLLYLVDEATSPKGAGAQAADGGDR